MTQWPKLGKGYANSGTLRQWNVMLLLKGAEFTDSVDTSKGTCKTRKGKEKNVKECAHPDRRHKSVCVLIDKDQKPIECCR